jgi:hypothetical protein
MGVENFVNEASAGKRSAKRARVLLAAKLKTEFGEVEARLRDLSQRGALVECNEHLDVGSNVVFTRGITIVPARVAWSAAGRVGLEFLRTIDESEVLVQLGRTAGNAPQQRFRRPRIGGEDMSETERKLVRTWGVAVGISVPGE